MLASAGTPVRSIPGASIVGVRVFTLTFGSVSLHRFGTATMRLFAPRTVRQKVGKAATREHRMESIAGPMKRI
jgi:hypothetical protein